MADIKAADVAKLRKATGAGMMDCKKALKEAEGNFDAAIDILRKKGQKVAGKRSDRDANEGAIIAKISDDGKKAALIVLNCETDFVAKNEDFLKLATLAAETAVKSNAKTLEELNAEKLENGRTIADEVVNTTGITGEKVELSNFAIIEAETTTAYIHPGNQIAAIVGFNKAISEQGGKDVAMQIAAMNPIAIDKDDVSEEVKQKEIEIGKELAINEGKPAELAEKIAIGRLNKFYKESTLLNQVSVKDGKLSIKQCLQKEDKELTVTAFKRFSLRD